MHKKKIKKLVKTYQPIDPMVAYQQLWDNIDQYYGKEGVAAPKLTIGNPVTGTTAATDPQTREVTIANSLAQSLAKRGKGKNARSYRRGAQAVLAHELAHVFQRPELFTQGRDLPWQNQAVEQGANQFSDAVMQRLYRPQKISQAKKARNKKLLRKLLAKPFLPLDTSQFQ